MSENSIELTKQQGLTKFLRLKKSTSQHASVFRFPGSCKQQRIDQRPSKRRIRHARMDSPAVEASPRDLNLGSKSPKIRRGGGGIILPVLTTGQLFLHSWRHFLGLHLSSLTIAIRVSRSAISSSSAAAERRAPRRKGVVEPKA